MKGQGGFILILALTFTLRPTVRPGGRQGDENLSVVNG